MYIYTISLDTTWSDFPNSWQLTLWNPRPLPLHLHLKAERRSKHPKCQDPEIENIREPGAGWNLDILPTKVVRKLLHGLVENACYQDV